ncbi:MAG: Na+/H+ antiporter subunit E [Actinobacteria bacterium]|nr:MAG: Na+/H+ antiporter subunit E [Actinomycetota bacterium]
MPPRPPLTPRDRRRNRIIAVTVLVTVWILLWGTVSWANLLSGLVVAAVVLTAFPLPPVTFAGRIRLIGSLRFLIRFLSDIVAASIQISLLAFRFGHTVHSAIIAVPLRVNSDLNLTLTGEAVSLVPGSLILDVDRARGILYIHVVGVATDEEVEAFRRSVYEVEARIVRAIGSKEELQRLTLPIPAGTDTGQPER